MGHSLTPKHLGRYKEVAGLLIKYGQGDLVRKGAVIDDPLDHVPEPAEIPKAKDLANDLERLGPTFIKLGQLVSTRADFVPKPYMDALTRLQDHVEPFPFEQVEAIVRVEIGARISRAFLEFESEPMAAASLGQVHRAILRNGVEVAVKVQRPNIRETVAEDLEALAEIAEALDAHSEAGRRYEFGKMIEELRRTLMRELDYRQEANNLKLMRKNLAEFRRIVVPDCFDDYCTGRVLTMEYISGTKITKLSPLTKLDLDGGALAEELFRAYLHQILVTGLYHADPHPGNIFLTDDRRIGMLDLGMVAHLSPSMQDQILRLLLAVSEGESNKAAEIAERMGTPKDRYDSVKFRREMEELANEQKHSTLGDMQLGTVLIEITRIAGGAEISTPPELTLLGKALMNLDIVGKTLSQDFDTNESIRRNAAGILKERTLKSISPGNLFTTFIDAKEFLEKLPNRLNILMDRAAENKLSFQVDAIDEDLLMSGMQKVANRITLGLILAALILGAAMLMRIETDFRLFGYPGIAIICFFLASAGGVALAIQILKSDRPDPKK